MHQPADFSSPSQLPKTVNWYPADLLCGQRCESFFYIIQMYMISQLRMNDGFCSTIWKTRWGCPVQAWSYTSLRTVSCPQFLRLLVLEMTAVICLNKELNGVTSRREKATLSWLVWRLLGDGTEWVSPGHSVEPKTPRTSVPSTVWFPGSVVNGWNVGKARAQQLFDLRPVSSPHHCYTETAAPLN